MVDAALIRTIEVAYIRDDLSKAPFKTCGYIMKFNHVTKVSGTLAKWVGGFYGE